MEKLIRKMKNKYNSPTSEDTLKYDIERFLGDITSCTYGPYEWHETSTEDVKKESVEELESKIKKLKLELAGAEKKLAQAKKGYLLIPGKCYIHVFDNEREHITTYYKVIDGYLTRSDEPQANAEVITVTLPKKEGKKTIIVNVEARDGFIKKDTVEECVRCREITLDEYNSVAFSAKKFILNQPRV